MLGPRASGKLAGSAAGAGRTWAVAARASGGPAVEDRLAALYSTCGMDAGVCGGYCRNNDRSLVDRTGSGLRHHHAAGWRQRGGVRSMWSVGLLLRRTVCRLMYRGGGWSDGRRCRWRERCSRGLFRRSFRRFLFRWRGYRRSCNHLNNGSWRRRNGSSSGLNRDRGRSGRRGRRGRCRSDRNRCDNRGRRGCGRLHHHCHRRRNYRNRRTRGGCCSRRLGNHRSSRWACSNSRRSRWGMDDGRRLPGQGNNLSRFRAHWNCGRRRDCHQGRGRLDLRLGG
jgi:hypothetical protein